MATKSRACVVVLLVITCGGSRAVGQSGWSIKAGYNYQLTARDDYQLLDALPPQKLNFSHDTIGANGVVDFPAQDLSAKLDPTASDGNSQEADGSVAVQAKVGSFHLKASADAFSTRVQNFLPLNKVSAEATTEVTITETDQLIFHSDKPGTRRVYANWDLVSSIGGSPLFPLSYTSSDAKGVVSPHGFDPNGNYDFVVGQGESAFYLEGTGVPSAPAIPPPHGGVIDPSMWAYSYTADGGITQPTIDHLEYDNPSSIPVSFLATPGRSLFVQWTISVSAHAIVNNFDLNSGGGSAGGSANYYHTVNWGGITSVVDADTGEPDTDWSVESASGFDYAHAAPEPEPASIVLAVIGSIAAAAIARRKSTAPRRA
jgi:hypothetical protein